MLLQRGECIWLSPLQCRDRSKNRHPNQLVEITKKSHGLKNSTVRKIKNVIRIFNRNQEQRYNNEGDLNDEWNLYDFIKKIWDDVSAASGNKHNFIIVV